MAFAQLDDKILDCPKALEAGEEATDLFIRGVIWCNAQLTDGRIPKAGLSRLSGKAHREDLAADLVRVKWWIDEGNAWVINDYLEHNPSRQTVLERREAAKLRANRSRNKQRTGDEGATHVQRTHDADAENVRRECAPLSSPLNSIEEDPPPTPSAGAAGTPSPGSKRPRKAKTPKQPVASDVGARVLARLNKLGKRDFEYSPQLEQLVTAGVPEADLMLVVEHQAQRPFMQGDGAEYFRPKTLFGRDNFREYLASAKAGPSPRAAPRLVGGLALETESRARKVAPGDRVDHTCRDCGRRLMGTVTEDGWLPDEHGCGAGELAAEASP